MIRDTLLHIKEHYAFADSVSHPEAAYARNTAPRNIGAVVRHAVGDNDYRFEGCKGSHGKPATCAWIAILDPTETTTAKKGVYLVYLFSTDLKRVYLSLNQGAYEVSGEFGNNKTALKELERRAQLMRIRLQDEADDLIGAKIDLTDTGFLRNCYVAGHALGHAYDLDALPDEETLTNDLARMLSLYQAILFRAGVEGVDTDSLTSDDIEGETLEEKRQYKTHRRLEGRNRKLAEKAKKIHGPTCQGCGFNFGAIYGERGLGYIEAHHLTPVSTLKPGINYPLDPKKDFAVLCANCHRIVHRNRDVINLDELRSINRVGELRILLGKFET